jgi:hypothetical protein
LRYIATFYSIDVMTFRDLVVDRAIQYASYNVSAHCPVALASFTLWLNSLYT